MYNNWYPNLQYQQEINKGYINVKICKWIYECFYYKI